MWVYESAARLPDSLCARICHSLFTIRAVALGARLEYWIVFSGVVCQPDQRVFCDGCNCFRDRADLFYPNRRETFTNATSVVANHWNIARRLIVWIPPFSFPTTAWRNTAPKRLLKNR